MTFRCCYGTETGGGYSFSTHTPALIKVNKLSILEFAIDRRSPDTLLSILSFLKLYNSFESSRTDIATRRVGVCFRLRSVLTADNVLPSKQPAVWWGRQQITPIGNLERNVWWIRSCWVSSRCSTTPTTASYLTALISAIYVDSESIPVPCYGAGASLSS